MCLSILSVAIQVSLYTLHMCIVNCSVHERETQRMLNKQSGLREIDSFNELDGKWSYSIYARMHACTQSVCSLYMC